MLAPAPAPAATRWWLTPLLLAATAAACRSSGDRRGDPGSPSTDPYQRWLSGQPGGSDAALVAPLPEVVRVAVETSALDRARLDWRREPAHLLLTWTLDAPPRQPCTALIDEAAAVLSKAGYLRMPAIEDAQLVTMRIGAGVQRGVLVGCREAESVAEPGCTGGDCRRPASVHVEALLQVPAPDFTDVAGALAPFPPLAEGVAARLLPPFLAERLATRRAVSVGCERWRAGTCEGDFEVWLELPDDPKAWTLETIDLAAGHGFQTSERYKDPAREWVGSSQACSGRNLFYKVERNQLWVRLAVTIGVEPAADPVRCSAQVVPATPVAAGTTVVLDMPLSNRTVAHLDQLAACYVAHQTSAGRTATTGAWKRLGDYLERPLVDATSRLGATIGTEHHMNDPEPADGFYLRTERPLPGGGSLQLYAVQDRFTASFGRVVLTVKDQHGSGRLTVQLGQADLAPLLGRDALLAAVLAAVDDQARRARAGASTVEDCEVLPNRGQRCDRRPATPDEVAGAEQRIERQRVELAGQLTGQAADLYAAVADSFPFDRADCPLFRPGAPR